MYRTSYYVRVNTSKKRRNLMGKKIILALTIIFIILSFIGAFYVLSNHGQVNAGYAVVPSIFAIACLTSYKKK